MRHETFPVTFFKWLFSDHQMLSPCSSGTPEWSLEDSSRPKQSERSPPKLQASPLPPSYSNLAVFTHTMVPSRCHWAIIRWLHGGVARISHGHVPFLRQSGGFLLPSYYLRESKNAWWRRWSHEVKTKVTRSDKMASRCHYEGQNGHTYSSRKWTFVTSSGNFLTCQRFCHCSRSFCRSLRNSACGHVKA